MAYDLPLVILLHLVVHPCSGRPFHLVHLFLAANPQRAPVCPKIRQCRLASAGWERNTYTYVYGYCDILWCMRVARSTLFILEPQRKRQCATYIS